MNTVYHPRGAQLRLRDVLDRMQNKPKAVRPLVYATQEVDAAKAVLLRLLRHAEATSSKVTSTTHPASLAIETTDEP